MAPFVLLTSLTVGCGDDGPSKADPGLDHWPEASAALEAEVLALVNQRRAAGATCGGTTYAPAPALTIDPLLEDAARAHSFDMVDREFFDHTNPDDESPGDRIDALGYAWSTWGENIAAGQSTAEQVMNTWMNSPGHCANIMNPDFENIGVGYRDQHWTQVFGAPP